MKKIFIFFFFFLINLLFSNKVQAAILFQDDFTGVDSTPLETHNANWTEWGTGTAVINNNQAKTGPTNTAGFAVSSINRQDLCLQADIMNIESGRENFLDFYSRADDLEDPWGFPMIQFMFNGDGTGFTHLHGTNLDIAGTFPTGISNEAHTLTYCHIGNTITWYIDGVSYGEVTDPNTLSSGYAGFSSSPHLILDNFKIFDTNPFESSETIITASPSASMVTVGTPFIVNVTVNSDEEAFNAAQASISVSNNLSVIGLSSPSTGACNFQYTQTPSTSNPSFAGALYGSSSTNCTVYSLTLVPTATGSGSIAFTNASVKSYEDHSEILTATEDGEYTIQAALPTPSPGFSSFTIENILKTYSSSVSLFGSRDPLITKVFVDNSDTNTLYPTSTTWSHSVDLEIGSNTFSVHGENAEEEETASQTVTIQRHTLGDINGDGEVNIIDVSLFAVDWGKTENFSYILSDMNNDSVINLTDLSILAKLLN